MTVDELTWWRNAVTAYNEHLRAQIERERG